MQGVSEGLAGRLAMWSLMPSQDYGFKEANREESARQTDAEVTDQASLHGLLNV